MALAGGFHVDVAVELDADLAACLEGGDGAEGTPGVALGFFAAEAAAHAGGFDDDLIAGEAEDFGDDGLDFAGVLGGAVDGDAAGVVGRSGGGVGL